MALALALTVTVNKLPGADSVAERVRIFDGVAGFDLTSVPCITGVAVASASISFDSQRAGLVAPRLLAFAGAWRDLARPALVPNVALTPANARRREKVESTRQKCKGEGRERGG